MNKKSEELKILFQELNDNPYRRLIFAFFLISIIPMLVLVYIFFNGILTNSEFLSNKIQILLFAGVIIILGYTIGYTLIEKIIDKTLACAAKARHADELKSKFAISLAHDLKSPLGTIKTNVSGLKAGYLGKLLPEQDKAVDICNNVSDRMNSMLTELIATYMFEAREARLNISRFDLNGLVQEGCRELETAASTKKITLIVKLPKDPLPIEADREKIVRVINNILNNSIKYTPENGKITINAYPADGFARMEFLNTSAAIPEEKLEKIFDKFERLDTSKEGHGLGLAIAKDIVELSGGKIWATSPEGKSTCFTILLPLAGAEKMRESQKSRKILLVEDDLDFVSTLRTFLEKRGYQIVVANNAADGIKAAGKEDVGLAILDLGLPDKDGFFVLDNLRKLAKTAGLPVIISTADEGDDVEKKAHEMGANDFIRKPYDIEKLLAKIKIFLP